MPLESAADFSSYLDSTTGHGVAATFFEVQNNFWDSRTTNFDTWFDVDSGNSTSINIILDQEYFNIQGNSVAAAGYQPRAMMKASDAPYISHLDKFIVDAITTNKGNILKPETTFLVVNAKPDNTGMISLVLEEQ